MIIENRQEGAELASRLLRYPVDEAFEFSEDVPEIDAFFYWQPIRGGTQLLVGRDGTVMFGISSLTLDEMVTMFADGERTELSEFEVE